MSNRALIPPHTADGSSPTQVLIEALPPLPDGQVVQRCTLQRGQLKVVALTLGGIVTQLMLPDRHDVLANVVLGFEDLNDYATRNPYFGALIGRYANRIAGGRLVVDGVAHHLNRNEGENTLHGGQDGLGKRLWRAEVENGGPERGQVLALHLVSPDGDQGFPGELAVCVRYSLPDAKSWEVHYEARSSQPTLVNLTQHSYFNLSGQGFALGHVLTMPARQIDAVGPGLIPTGALAVAGTPFDFRQPQAIGARLADAHPQLALGGGYDHNWRLDEPTPEGSLTPRLAAQLHCPATGRTMRLLSTAPGLQFYSGNFLDGSLPAPGGGFHQRGSGVCLEPQYFPDAPNRLAEPGVISPVLRPGETWQSVSRYEFGVD